MPTPATSTAPRRSLPLALLAPLLLTLTCACALSAPAALAVKPWWHLTSGTRPAHLHAGVAQDELQSLTVSGKAGEMVKLEEIDPESEVHRKGEFLVGAPASTVQGVLEGMYGASNVTVSGAGPYAISFTGQLKDQPVELLKVQESSAPASLTRTATGRPDGEIYLSAENLGDAFVFGGESQVKLSDVLPADLQAIGVAGTEPFREGSFTRRAKLPCALEAGGARASCAFTGVLAPYDQLELRIAVLVGEGASSGEPNELSVSGGNGFDCKPIEEGPYIDNGCTKEREEGGSFERSSTGAIAPESITRAVTISDTPASFGVEDFEMSVEDDEGQALAQAGAHPFQLTTTFALNQTADSFPVAPWETKPNAMPIALPKDFNFKLPAGLIGDPTPFAQCTTAEFYKVKSTPSENLENQNRCPASSAVGVATVTVNEPAAAGGVVTVTLPVFNLEPGEGEPARFGFYVTQANTPVFIDTSVRSGADYGVTVSTNRITQTAGLLDSELTFWGVPGDPRHAGERGWGCLYGARGSIGSHFPCDAGLTEQSPPPFLSLPTYCGAGLQSSVEGDSWSQVGDFVSFPGTFTPSQPLEGCDRLAFDARFDAQPDTQRASSPAGLSTDVHVPQEANRNSAGLASSEIKDIAVELPEGLTVNPASAGGLESCSESQIGYIGPQSFQPGVQSQTFTATLPEHLQPGVNFCPNESKLASVKIKVPPLAHPLEGAVYLADPAPNGEASKNPFNSLIAIYLVAGDPASGVLVKLPGTVALDEGTGRARAVFQSTPQAPLEDAEIDFFSGPRAALSTPAHCTSYPTIATFTPWSGNPQTSSESSFQITSGPNGSPCPAQSLPFSPTLSAGTQSARAGAFSALSTTIAREDGQQALQGVQLRTPPGLSGVLSGVTLCTNAQAAANSCPQGSLIGHASASVGTGPAPYTVSGGQVFLTEGYAGAPFGLSILTPAKAGPFDLGFVNVRARVEVDPHTAQITVTTDSIPHILRGVPLQIRRVDVSIDRPGFTFNPTNCASFQISAQATGLEGGSAPLSAPFQAVNCATLKFAPKFSVSTAAKTSKANGASLLVKLTYPPSSPGAYANVGKVKVSLPKELPSRLTTLQKACTAQLFEANPASCPPQSIVGHATVRTPLLPVALTGPAYFVSHGGEAFPDLTIVLQGYGITVDLIGSTSIKNGVTTSTFRSTPDVPFSSFELDLPQGPYSALTANASLCSAKLQMPSEFIAQNGAVFRQTTKIAVTGCPHTLSAKQKLQKALRACQKKRKAARKACEAKARRRFAVKGAGVRLKRK